jgi:AMMECR1 domain-containing protein
MLVSLLIEHLLNLPPTLSDQEKKALDEIPRQDAFGVFVTVRRQHTPSRGDDVHGCIGHWDNAFEMQSREWLMKTVKRVGMAAMYQDDRRQHFRQSLEEDAGGLVEIDFMMLPVVNVDAETGYLDGGEKFSNDRYGLIVEEDGGGRRATYLPNVFSKDTPWQTLQRLLVQKAGSTNGAKGTRVKFWAYRTHILKQTMWEFMVGPYTQRWLSMYAEFLHKQAHPEWPFVPYSQTKYGVVHFAQDQAVRNLGTLLTWVKLGGDAAYLKTAAKAYTSKDLSGAAQAFLTLLNVALGENALNLCSGLLDALPDADPVFARSQILMALAEACPQLAPHVQKWVEAMCQDLPTGQEAKDVFQLNWNAQLARTNVSPKCLETIRERLPPLDLSAETNYLVVRMECLAQGLQWSAVQRDAMVACFFTTQKRRNKWGLLAFRDGEARVDITDHAVNALKKVI